MPEFLRAMACSTYNAGSTRGKSGIPAIPVYEETTKDLLGPSQKALRSQDLGVTGMSYIV